MHRVDADGHDSNQFTDGDPGIPEQPTALEAKWHNAVQEELANTVEDAGITLDDGDDNQLTDAIKQLAPLKCFARFVTDGAGNITLPTNEGFKPVGGAGQPTIATNGRLTWAYVKEFASQPVISVFLPYKASGFYVAGYEALGGPTADGRIRIKDESGTVVNLATTALEIHVTVSGYFLTP